MVDSTKLCKVILLGETGVDKESIIRLFLNNEYEDEDNIMSTTRASYAGKTVSINKLPRKKKIIISSNEEIRVFFRSARIWGERQKCPFFDSGKRIE